MLRGLACGGDETRSTDRSLANLLANLGLLYATQERLDEAVPYWVRAEAMDRRLRPGSPGHRQLLSDLATAQEMLGQVDAAAATRARAAEYGKAAK